MNEQEASAKLMAELYDINHMIRNIHLKNEQSFGDWRILSMIHHHTKISGEGIKASTIAELLKVSLPTVSQRAADFEQQGYIYRKQSAKDRRVYYLRLTEDGEKVISERRDVLTEKCIKAAEGLGTEKTRQLYSLLLEFKECLNQVNI